MFATSQESFRPSTSLELTPIEVAWIRDHPVVRYGSDPAWPPFSQQERNHSSGLDHEYIELVSHRLGVRFEYVPSSDWNDTLARFNRGEIDLLTGVADLPSRRLDLLYTDPITTFPLAIIVRRDGPFFESLARMARDGVPFAGPAGYAPTVFLETRYPALRLTPTRTSLEALTLVSNGEADAVLENLGVASHLVRSQGLSNLKITGVSEERFDPRFGVRTDLPILRGLLDKALDQITEAERLQINDKWVMLETSRLWDWKRVLTILAPVLGAATLIVLILLYLNRRLQRELTLRRAAEDSLRSSEARFRHLFETMPDAFLLTQTDGRIQFVNETAVSMLGIGSKPVIERLNLATFLGHPEDLPRILSLLRTHGRVLDHPIEFVRSDGRHLNCLCHVQLVNGRSGEEAGLEWIASRDEDPDREPPCLT